MVAGLSSEDFFCRARTIFIVRRIGRVYALLMLGAVCLLSVSLTRSASAQSYNITDLGQGVAFGVNNVGQVVGYSGGAPNATIWNGTTPTILGSVPGQSRSIANGINDAGQVVGYSLSFNGNGDQISQAVIWHGSAPTLLGSPAGGISSSANAINNAGQVVGQSVGSSNIPQAVIWNGTAPTVLGGLGGSNGSGAYGINNAGQVVGLSYAAGNQPQAVLWNGTSPTVIGLTTAASGAVAINNAGRSVGASYTPVGSGGPYIATTWNGNTPTILGTLGGATSTANAINDAGQIVGYSTTALNSGTRNATIWDGTTPINLNSLLTVAGWTLMEATGINNAGQIVGYGIAPGGITDAFLLTPVAQALLDLAGINQAFGSLAGVVSVTNSGISSPATLTVGGNNTSTTFSGVIADGNSATALTKLGTGTFTLSGTNTYSGATSVNAGVLEVDGSIASSSLTSVNNGGMLIGTGTVGNTQINSGGTFAPGAAGVPGTAMTVQGNLAFQSGALYVVQINPATSTLANVVTGTATLAGNVLAVFAPGNYMMRDYTILQSAGLNGTFDGLGTVNLPPDFIASLKYSADDVLLNLTANLLPPAGMNGNQGNVANALNNFFNSGGTLTPNFLTLFGLSGGSLANALSQLSGEAAADGEKGAFDVMTSFLGLMLDPFADGRGFGAGNSAIPFAADREAGFPPDIALAYAAVLKAPPKPAPLDQRWSAWGSAFGGSNTTNGNATTGTSNVTANIHGFAAGMDYRFSPDTMAGFALAGGGTNWSLAQGLGGGRSDAFQVGIYGKTRSGPAYLAAALAFTNNWMTTNRNALGDQLTASFDAQSYGGRLEAGYRYGMPVKGASLGVTPYAALQSQSFHTPGYSETDLTGGGFGLSYNAMNAIDTRSELGARFDDLTMLGAMPLTLRARVAWAHDWVSNPSLGAVFQALPGASFTVNGAAPPPDSALVSAGAELHIANNWSLAAKFDGEFAPGSQTYAGTGTIKYVW
jgi:autotransporter-associated beta strand protein/probable HAF family extracellular repeat protein